MKTLTFLLPVSDYDKQISFLRSNRITFFTDIIKGIRIIKVYCKGKLTENIIFNQ